LVWFAPQGIFRESRIIAQTRDGKVAKIKKAVKKTASLFFLLELSNFKFEI